MTGLFKGGPLERWVSLELLKRALKRKTELVPLVGGTRMLTGGPFDAPSRRIPAYTLAAMAS